MIKPGDKLIRRHDGKELVVYCFFIIETERKLWSFNLQLQFAAWWNHELVIVKFLDGSTDYYYHIANTQKYMLPDEQDIFNQTFQPWDDADLVPNP